VIACWLLHCGVSPTDDQDALRPAARRRRRHQPRTSTTGLRLSHAGIARSLAPPGPCRDEGELRRAAEALHDGLGDGRPVVWRVRRGTQDDVALFARLHAPLGQHQGSRPSHSTTGDLYRGLARPVTRSCSSGKSRQARGRSLVHRLRRCTQVSLVGMDRDAAAGGVERPAAAEWEAIRWAKANDYRWFDSRNPRNGGVGSRGRAVRLVHADKFRGVKAGFGGTPFRYRRLSKSSLRR